MTEAEWDVCTEPGCMLSFLGDSISDRKKNLYWVARRNWGKSAADYHLTIPKDPGFLGDRPAARAADARLIREVFGNPLVSIILDPYWLTSTVSNLAETIYKDRAFDTMPILADALEDAGCTNADILNHCRQAGEHVRGCWVIDLLTGRK